MVLLNYNSLLVDRSSGVSALLRICADIFGSLACLDDHRASLLLGISRCSKYTMNLPRLRRFIADAQCNDQARQHLAERLFAFDPCERDRRISKRGGATEPLPADWWSRSDLLREIQALTPLPATARTFSTVLTTDDQAMLRSLSERVAASITEAMETRQYSQAAAHLTSLHQLSLIENDFIAQLLRDQESHLRRLVHDLRVDFDEHCHTHQFEKARQRRDELMEATRPFAAIKGMADLVLPQQLKETYAEAHAKYDATQAQHAALEQQIAAAESERADAQRKLAEQQQQHEALIAKLQSQVHQTETEKAASDKARVDLERKVADSSSALAQAEANQQELLRLREAEKARKELDRVKSAADKRQLLPQAASSCPRCCPCWRSDGSRYGCCRCGCGCGALAVSLGCSLELDHPVVLPASTGPARQPPPDSRRSSLPPAAGADWYPPLALLPLARARRCSRPGSLAQGAAPP